MQPRHDLTLQSGVSVLISESLNSIVFWSVISAVPLLIWYFPLWNMGISGFELALLSFASPFLLSFKKIYYILALKNPIICPLFAVLFGIGSYLLPSPEARLIVTALGGIFAALNLALRFSNSAANPILSLAKSQAFLLGLIAFSILKLFYYTNNPIWPVMNSSNGGLNKSGLFLGVFSVLITSYPIVLTQTQGSNSSNFSSHSNIPKRDSIAIGLGLGGILYILHSLFIDSSTLTLWVFDGYPLKGPSPIPHGALVIFSLLSGVLFSSVSSFSPKVFLFIRSIKLYFFACIASIILYFYPGWLGFAGGLFLGFYVASVTPLFMFASGITTLIPSSSKSSSSKSSSNLPFSSTAAYYSQARIGMVYGIAFLFYIILFLMHVWVTAYAFVPGGPMLRERTNLIFILFMTSLGFGLLSVQRLVAPTELLPAASFTQMSHSRSFLTLKRSVKHALNSISVFLVILTAIGVLIRYPNAHGPHTPYHPEAKLVTTGIMAIHFALDNNLWESTSKVKVLLEELELDIVGFLETDTMKPLLGNRDMTQQLAEQLGMYADYGPGPNKHTWGCLMLSKFPIIQSTHHLLPSPVGELAPAIFATLDIYDTLVDVIVFHSGQEEDEYDRLLQTKVISELMGNSTRPLILLSYLVTDPHVGNYLTYVSEKTRMLDIDPSDNDRWCEYILYRGVHRTGYARISHGDISDTEIQTGKFVIGEPQDPSNEEIDEDDVPPELRYPSIFYGNGSNGHFFHVFDRPKYYK